MKLILTVVVLVSGLLACQARAQEPSSAAQPHNIIIFVADGLRYGSVEAANMPNMARLKARGVDFTNSHSLFPTVTTVNASAIATGHYIGDSGDFGNIIFTGRPKNLLKSNFIQPPPRLCGSRIGRLFFTGPGKPMLTASNCQPLEIFFTAAAIRAAVIRGPDGTFTGWRWPVT